MTAPMHSRPTTASPLPPMNNRKRTALCLLGAALCVYDFWCPCAGPLPHNTGGAAGGDAMAVRTFTVLAAPRRYGADRRLWAGGGRLCLPDRIPQPAGKPDIIGVSSGASVGAAFAILFVSSGALSTTVCAFAGGLAAVFLAGAGRCRAGAQQNVTGAGGHRRPRWPRRC